MTLTTKHHITAKLIPERTTSAHKTTLSSPSRQQHLQVRYCQPYDFSYARKQLPQADSCHVNPCSWNQRQMQALHHQTTTAFTPHKNPHIANQ